MYRFVELIWAIYSPGPDGIHPTFLKHTKSLVGPLTKIMQLSMREGKLPQQWKKSIMISVYKKGDKLDPTIHRQITLHHTLQATGEDHVRAIFFWKIISSRSPEVTTSVYCRSIYNLKPSIMCQKLETIRGGKDSGWRGIRGNVVDWTLEKLLVAYLIEDSCTNWTFTVREGNCWIRLANS